MDPDAALAPVAAAQLGIFTLAQARAGAIRACAASRSIGSPSRRTT
jgi:hypothetical protein